MSAASAAWLVIWCNVQRHYFR